MPNISKGSGLFLKARTLVSYWHKDQKYGKHAYMYHLEQVVAELNSFCTSDYEVRTMVAYLHDILEDTKCPEEAILDIFPIRINKKTGEEERDERAAEILDAVKLLSKNYSESYEEYIEGIRGSRVALMVKVADSTCNLKSSLYNWNRGRVIKYVKQIKLLTEGGYDGKYL